MIDDFRACSTTPQGLDALWSGTPVITLAKAKPTQRMGASLLYSVQLQDRLIARDIKDYKDKVIKFTPFRLDEGILTERFDTSELYGLQQRKV